MIGGFIITGNTSKKLIVRALGPSLPVSGALDNPALELYDASGLIAANDDWRTAQEKDILATTIPPPSDKEAAVVATLSPGAYTAVLRGVNDSTGVALVEVYDLGGNGPSRLSNISTRGFVQTEDEVLIGGLIVAGDVPKRMMIRAIGPSLPLDGRLDDPTVELIDADGSRIAFNDDWRQAQEAEIIATTIAPTSNLESAVVTTLPPSNYTAVVRGFDNSTGVGLVEVYALE